METGIVLVVMAFIIGLVLGIYAIRPKPDRTESQGVIYVYCNDSCDGCSPSLLLESSVPIDVIASKKEVSFTVVVIR